MGEYTDNNYFYLPTYKAKGLSEKEKFDDALKATDSQIATNKSDISTIKKEIFSNSYTFADRLSEIGSTDTELIINSEIAINSNTTVPANVTLNIRKGGKFAVASGVTLTINGVIKAGRYQIFDGDGSVSGSPQFSEGYPEWFGAVGDGTTDDRSAFQSIFNIANGKIVKLKNNTTYKITSDGVALYGSVLNMSVGSKLYGQNATLKLHITDNIHGILPKSYCEIKDVSIELISSGTATGARQQCITFGDPEVSTSDIHDCIVSNVTLDSDLDNGNACALGIYGDVYNVLLDRITIDNNSTLTWGIVMSHWGGSDYFPGNVWDGTNYVKYPYNITLRNSTIKNLTRSGATAIAGGPGVNNVVEGCFIYNVATGYYNSAVLPPQESIIEEQRYILCSCVAIRDTVISDVRDWGLYLNHEVNTILGADPNGEYDNDVAIENCIVTGKSGESTAGVYLKYARNLVIQNCSFKNLRHGIIFNGYNKNCKVLNNIIDNIEYSGIKTPDGTVENDCMVIGNNVITNCNTSSGGDAENKCCIYNRGDYWKINNNILGEVTGETAIYAVHCVAGSDNNTITNNTVRSITTAAFNIESSENILSWNKVASGIDYIVNSNGNNEIQRKPKEIITFTDGDATPSVSEGNLFKTANSSDTTITLFDDGYLGKQIVVFIEDNNTVFDFTGTNLKGNGGEDWHPIAGDILIATFDGANWYCTVSQAKKNNAAFMVHLGGTNQSISSGTWTKVQWTTEEYDDNGVFDNATNYRFTAPVDGIYTFTAYVQLRDLSDQKIGLIRFYKNGSNYHRAFMQTTSTGGSAHLGLSATMTVKLNGGDYIEVYVYHDYGSARDIDGSTVDGCYFCGARIA